MNMKNVDETKLKKQPKDLNQNKMWKLNTSKHLIMVCPNCEKTMRKTSKSKY